jgi:AcrR family transcriptional regulator
MKPPARVETQSPNAAKVTRGHKKKARTREQLLNAAFRIYGRKSVGELALSELAEETGVSNGTVHNYFRTRDDVVHAVSLELAVRFSQHIAAATPVLGAERLSLAVRSFVRRAAREPAWGRALVNLASYSDVMRSALADYLREDLRVGHASGELRHTHEDVAVVMVLWTALGAVESAVEGSHIEAHDSVVAEMILLGLGMSPQKAKRLAARVLPDAPASSDSY